MGYNQKFNLKGYQNIHKNTEEQGNEYYEVIKTKSYQTPEYLLQKEESDIQRANSVSL